MREASSRSLRRGLLSVLVVVCLVLPLVALSGTVVLVYYAGFNEAASSTGGSPEIYQALGGDAILEGPPAVFDVEFDQFGDGAAVAHGNPTGQPAFLDCRLQPTFQGDIATITMDLTRSLGPGDLVFRVADDNDTGALDVVFDDDGDVVIVVGAMAVPMGLGPDLLGYPLDITIVLQNVALGQSTWDVMVSGNGQHFKVDGELETSGPIRVASMRFIRPAGELSGDDEIDDVTLTTLNEVETTQQSYFRN